MEYSLFFRERTWQCSHRKLLNVAKFFQFTNCSIRSDWIFSTRVSMNILKYLCPNCIISWNGNIPWSPRSPDLTACNFFLWVYIKSWVYQTALRTLSDHTQISREILRNVMTNVQRCLDECLQWNICHHSDSGYNL